MMVRKMQLPGWYPQNQASCTAAVEQFIEDASLPSDLPGNLVGGLCPHAGWTFSGGVAAYTFKAIAADRTPDTVVVFGAGHGRVKPPRQPALYAEGAWETPLGLLEVDTQLAEQLLAATDLVVEDTAAHEADNTIEVQTPFIKYLWPEAKFLPITMCDFPRSANLGRRLAQVVKNNEIDAVFIGSTDLTHYGAEYYGWAPRGVGIEAHEWAKANDRRFIEKVLAMSDEQLAAEARENRNACGAGAAAATIAASAALGAKAGCLLVHTTSYEVKPEGQTPSNFVGYASVVF